MKEVKINVDELVDALESGELSSANYLIKIVVDTFNDEEIIDIVKRLSNTTTIKSLFFTLKKKGRLKNIVKSVWNHNKVIKQFDEFFFCFPHEFKDYVLKALEMSPNINMRKIIAVSLSYKIKIDKLDTYPNFKVIVFELGVKDTFEHYYYVLMAHKLYGILTDSELKEVLNGLRKRLMRIKSRTRLFLRPCVELYIEFAKIDDFKTMKKLMSFIENKNDRN